MIIGIPTDDGIVVSEHFGRSGMFLIADVDGGKVASNAIVENPHNKEEKEQSGHGKLLKMLVEHKVNRVVCSNLNPRMQQNLESVGISVDRCGVDSSIEKILEVLSR